MFSLYFDDYYYYNLLLISTCRLCLKLNIHSVLKVLVTAGGRVIVRHSISALEKTAGGEGQVLTVLECPVYFTAGGRVIVRHSISASEKTAAVTGGRRRPNRRPLDFRFKKTAAQVVDEPEHAPTIIVEEQEAVNNFIKQIARGYSRHVVRDTAPARRRQ